MSKTKTSQRRGSRQRDTHILRTTARRRDRRRRIRRTVGWLLGGGVLLGLLLWGGHVLWTRGFLENEFFNIRDIEIVTDGSMSTELIQEFAGVKPGMSLFAVRPNDVRDKLLAVPVVARAQVGRRFPDALVIDITERMAVARLSRVGAGTPLAVDAEGHVLGPGSVRRGLPVVAGVRDKGLLPGQVVQDSMLAKALQILDICNQSPLRQELAVLTVDVGDDERISLGLKSGEQVLLSLEHIEEKLKQLPVMMAVARRRGLDLSVYDLTADRNYAGWPEAMGK